MKRLFAIRTEKGILYPSNKAPDHFPNKSEAKMMRDTLNNTAGNKLYFVTLGPDHVRYNGDSDGRKRG